MRSRPMRRLWLIAVGVLLVFDSPAESANLGKWNTPSAEVTVLSSELNGLGINTASAASTAIANQTSLDLYWDCTLHLASLTPTAGAYVTVYILEATDNATYPSATGTVLRNQPSQILFSLGLDTATAAQDIVARNIVIPPHSFKVVLD